MDNIRSNCHKWVELFSDFHILLGVCGLRDNDTFLIYDVLHDGRLGMIHLEDECMGEVTLNLLEF